MSFTLLKKQSSDKSRLDALVSNLEKTENKSYNDPSFWTITKDKQGNGTAVIRFLPASPGDEQLVLPVVEKYEHRFKGKTGLWYIENSLTSVGKPDPVGEWNQKTWATGDETLQAYIRNTTKRKQKLIANILVVSDPSNPENNGKVFKFEFGKKIYEKILNAIKGDPVLKKRGTDIFDYWKGADFVLKVKIVSEYPNYDDSYFDVPSTIHYEGQDELTDEQIEKDIYMKQYKLSDELAEDKFKSYEALKARFEKVMGLDSTDTNSDDFSKYPNSKSRDEDEDEVVAKTAAKKQVGAKTTQQSKPAVSKKDEETTSYTSEDIDAILGELDL